MLELFYPPVGLYVSFLVGTSDVPENVPLFHEKGQNPVGRPAYRALRPCCSKTPLCYVQPIDATAQEVRHTWSTWAWGGTCGVEPWVAGKWWQ